MHMHTHMHMCMHMLSNMSHMLCCHTKMPSFFLLPPPSPPQPPTYRIYLKSNLNVVHAFFHRAWDCGAAAKGGGKG